MQREDERPAAADEGCDPARARWSLRRWIRRRRWRVAYLVLAHTLGLIASIDALMTTRTSSGAVAWIVSLNTLPALALPAYWVFGRDRFEGYRTIRQDLHARVLEESSPVLRALDPFVSTSSAPGELVGQRLADMRYLRGNRLELLVDGRETFDSIFAGIAAARRYVLLQFYIVRDDRIGGELKDLLLAKLAEGVEVYFLYDALGSRQLPDEYVRELSGAGAEVSAFSSTRGRIHRFQINFRNHRKIVVADGRQGWLGGINVGDDYLGGDPEHPVWRDTHLFIEGPAVLQLQLSFAEDWRWVRDEMPELDWRPHAAAEGDARVLVLPSGPADRLETASLMYQQAIHSARERIWIASPYFVPDSSVLSALHLAALRGVDVKILLPERSDSTLVHYSGYAFAGPLLASGVEFHRYVAGFLHQKVFLVDDRLAGVGTANLDNRSLRLNFEVTALCADADFAADVEAMLEEDLAGSRPMTLEDLEQKGWWFHVLARAAFLTAPIQ